MKLKFYTKRMGSFGLVLGLLLSPKLSFAQLTGSVSIGSAGTYASWSAFASDLSTKGHSGGLTVTVLENLSESSIVYLKSPSTGSSTNAITIDGNKKALMSSNADAAIILDGIDYVTVKDLTVEKTNTGSNPKGFQFMNGANYNTISNCTIYFSGLTTANTSTSTGGAYVVFSNSATAMLSSSTTYAGIYNTVEKCRMYTRSGSPGPTAAVWINGSSSLYSGNPTNNTIRGNTIENFYYYGMYTTYTNGDQFTANDISRVNATSNNMSATGMSFYSNYTYSTNRSTKIDGNRVHDIPYVGAGKVGPSTFYGVYSLYNYGNSTNYYTIEKNEFVDMFATTVYVGYNLYNQNMRVISNFVDNWDAGGSHYGWYNLYNSGKTFANKNTTINCFSTNISYGIACAYGSDEVEMNGNIFKHNQFCQTTTTSYTLPGVAFVYLFQPTTSYNHKVNFNVVDSNEAAAYYSIGVFTYYANAETSNNTITNNSTKVSGGTAYSYWWSIWNYYCYNVRTNNNLIANNFGYYGQYGMYVYSFNSGNYKLEVRDNTIQMDGTGATYQYSYNYGMYMYAYY